MDQERTAAWQTAWLLLCMTAVAMSASLFDSPTREILTLLLAGAGALALFVGHTTNMLLITLIAYALGGFYLTLSGIAWFSVDIRQFIAIFKNLIILASFAWIAVQYRGSLRLLPWAWAFLVAVLAFQPFQDYRFSLPWAGYGLNTYLPLALFFLAFYALSERSHPVAHRFVSSSLYMATLLFMISAIVGLVVSLYLLPNALIVEQQALKGYGHIDGYPRNWWSYLGGSLYLRLAGTAEDPVFFGYIAGFLAYIWLSRGSPVWAGLLVLLVIASLVKGAMMLLLGGVVFWAILYFSRPVSFLRSWLAITLLGGLIAFYVIASGISQTSADVHVLGLWLPFEQMLKGETSIIESVFGHGIGSSGNLYKSISEEPLSNLAWLQGGAESSFGLIFYQTGFVGLALLLALILRGFQRCRMDAARGLWIVYWANAAVQENLINLNYLTLLFITVAILELPYRKDQHHAPGHN